MSKANILIVEDERIVARDLQATLLQAGYNVSAVVASGEQAVRKAAETQPDLVLMDVMLTGEMDGIEAAQCIRAVREIPIVYLTANGDRAVLEQAKATTPIAFILKPYVEQDLLTTLEVTLHQYRSQQARTQEALEESEERYRELFETARDGIAITELNGRHRECNPAYLKLTGHASAEELHATTLEELTAPEFRGTHLRVMWEQTLARGHSDECEISFVRRDGTCVAVSARAWLRRDRNGAPLGLWVLVRDISERKAGERRILDYQNQLQSLMAELSAAEEKERQRIATDIHDRISQTLAVCQMRLEALASMTPAGAAQEEMKTVCGLLERTAQETSSLVFELCPPVLHQLGLGAALEWLGEKIQHEHGLQVEVWHEAPLKPPPEDCRNALYRAAAELMNNAVKHAHARRLRVSLEVRGGTLELVVEDDGRGLVSKKSDPTARERGGFGLFHIRERLRAWGGNLEIKSEPGRGTRACMTVNLDRVEIPED